MAHDIRHHRSPHTNALIERIARALPKSEWRTRFAPAPTGYLHLGHVVNALHVWGIARAFGGPVQLRIEDHDATRARPEFERALLDDLDWLGFAPDFGTTSEFRNGTTRFRQSDNLVRYRELLAVLETRGFVYPCTCTRADIARASNTTATRVHAGEEVHYPGTCAHALVDATLTSARRTRMSNIAEQFDDIALGLQMQSPAEQCGDVLVRDRNGNFTYQFAVVVDDFDQNIDVVIRGEDLLPSTGRQMQLARMLGRSAMPAVLHHALIMREDGIKLSKSLGDSGVRELREQGLSASDVLGRAAHSAGLITRAIPIETNEIAELFAP